MSGFCFGTKYKLKHKPYNFPLGKHPHFLGRGKSRQQRWAVFLELSRPCRGHRSCLQLFLSSQGWLRQSSQVTLNSASLIENTVLPSSHMLYFQKEKGTVKKPDLREETLHHYIRVSISVFLIIEKIYFQQKHSLKMYSFTLFFSFVNYISLGSWIKCKFLGMKMSVIVALNP